MSEIEWGRIENKMADLVPQVQDMVVPHLKGIGDARCHIEFLNYPPRIKIVAVVTSGLGTPTFDTSWGQCRNPTPHQREAVKNAISGIARDLGLMYRRETLQGEAHEMIFYLRPRNYRRA